MSSSRWISSSRLLESDLSVMQPDDDRAKLSSCKFNPKKISGRFRRLTKATIVSLQAQF
jgi:hypothetical protein